MSMSKSNSKGKSLGPLFSKKGDGGLKTFEFDIRSGSYLNRRGDRPVLLTTNTFQATTTGGWARSSQAVA